MDGPSQSQHSNSDIVIHKVSAKEARIEFKVNPSRDKQGKWRGGRTCSVVDTVITAHIVMGLEGLNSSNIPKITSCVTDG